MENQLLDKQNISIKVYQRVHQKEISKERFQILGSIRYLLWWFFCEIYVSKPNGESIDEKIRRD